MRIILISDSHLGSLSGVFEPNWHAAPVKRMAPLPLLSIAGTTSREQRNAPNAFTRQVFSKVLGFVSIRRPNGRIAAL
jgi:hypothetical protein